MAAREQTKANYVPDKSCRSRILAILVSTLLDIVQAEAFGQCIGLVSEVKDNTSHTSIYTSS